jgi:plastocyanin
VALAAVLVLVLAVAGCGGAPSGTGGNTGAGGTTGSGGQTVTESGLAFQPSTLTVQAGQTVTFKNADQTAHHVVVGTDDLGEQQPGQDVTWKAPADGVYNFKCVIHPSMTGQITVGAGGSTVGTSSGTSGTGGY